MLQVSVQTQYSDYKPKDEVTLYIDGHPGTQVALLAIDSSVYLLQDNDKLTEEKVCYGKRMVCDGR